MSDEEDGSLTPEQIGAWLAETGGPNKVREELDLSRLSKEKAESSKKVIRRLVEDDVSQDLRSAGWGVIFPQGEAGRYEHLLGPLLELRRGQAGTRFFRFTRRKNESATAFLERHGETPGTNRLDRVPYYLVVAGSPEEISFEFQYQLSVDHAVGRIHFDDPQSYLPYVRNVRDAERRPVSRPRRTSIFSVVDNYATEQLDEHLTKPLSENLQGLGPGWAVDVWEEARSDKAHLARLLGGADTPGLLVACCHGLKIKADLQERQLERQGALICRGAAGGPREYFAAHDVEASADLRGLIAVFFACYGAGTPMIDNFPELTGPVEVSQAKLKVLAKKPFLARLPQTLLSRGALAVVGHVDRGWIHSVSWRVGGQRIRSAQSFEDSLKRLLRGYRLGHALRPLYHRYVALSEQLLTKLGKVRLGLEVDLKELGTVWEAFHDARNFIVLGDPAVYALGQRPREREAWRTVKLRAGLFERVSELAEERGLDVAEWLESVVEETIPRDEPLQPLPGARSDREVPHEDIIQKKGRSE